MPFSANVAISDRYEGNDDFADDGCENCLPHTQPDGDQSGSNLPVAQADLVDGPERNIGQSGPGTTVRRKGSNVIVDPNAQCAITIRDSENLKDAHF